MTAQQEDLKGRKGRDVCPHPQFKHKAEKNYAHSEVQFNYGGPCHVLLSDFIQLNSKGRKFKKINYLLNDN